MPSIVERKTKLSTLNSRIGTAEKVYKFIIYHIVDFRKKKLKDNLGVVKKRIFILPKFLKQMFKLTFF